MATKARATPGTRKAPAKKRAPRKSAPPRKKAARKVSPPLPAGAITELQKKLGKSVPLKGWDDCPPRYVTPVPQVRGAWWDIDAVVRVIDALCDLKHTKGRWANKPLIPDPWQIVWVIAPVFGWKHPDGTRIIREALVEIPRKNGKSTLSSGFGLILLAADGEEGAEVYAAATTKPQAGIVLDAAKAMVRKSPGLRTRLESLVGVIRFPRRNGIFRVLSSVADAAHGLNVSGGVIDELHVHKNRDLVDVIITGTGSRDQPLIIIITTADDGREGTIYDEKHEYARKLALKIIRDASFYGVIWCADDDDDPFAEDTWKKCNPGYGRSLQKAFIKKEAEKARVTPSYFPTFCRLHLNIRQRPYTRFIDLDRWDKSAGGVIVPERLSGRECYGGLDLSATTDLTSLVLTFPDAKHEALDVLAFFWMPADGLEDRVKSDHVPYDAWAREGFITLTEGSVIDYESVIDRIVWVRKHFDLRRMSHDRWQAGPVVQSLEKHGIESVPVGQGFQGMSAGTKELERLYLNGAFHHGGNPVLRFCADSVEVQHDKYDNIRPVKPDRSKSTKRVDGITASIMSIDGWMRRPGQSLPVPATAAVGGGDSETFRPTTRLDI